MNAISRRTMRLGLFMTAVVSFTFVSSMNIGPVNLSNIVGVEQAHAQRAANRRDRSRATGAGIASQRVADAYNEALEALQADNPAGAMAILQVAMEDSSPFELSLIYRLMGQVEIERDNFGAAAGHFQRAIDSGGLEGADRAQLYLVLGQIYTVDGQYDRAIRTLQQYFVAMREAELEPEPPAYYTLAQVYAVAERYSEAIPPARTAVDMTAAEPRENFIRLLMSIYLLQEQWSDALPLLQQLVAIDPTKDNYWSTLAGIYQTLGREEEAFAVFQFRYMMGFLESSSDLVTLSELYMFHNVPIKAAQLLQRELDAERVERTADNWEKLGNAYFTAREFRDSRAALTRAANLSPEGQIYYRIAGTYIQEENWSQALRFLRRAVNRGGLDDVGQAWILIGHAHNALDQLDEAEEAFERAADFRTFRDDARTWIEHIGARKEARRIHLITVDAYTQEAASILRIGRESVVLAETALGLAEEAYETARLATRVTPAERVTLLETARATLEEAREADNDARNPNFGTAPTIRANVRRIGVAARRDGSDELAEELEAGSEEFLVRRTEALTRSDSLIREADDMIYEAEQM